VDKLISLSHAESYAGQTIKYGFHPPHATQGPSIPVIPNNAVIYYM